MLSKNNKSKTILATLILIILSLNVVASLITISAPNYASAQVSDQNATTTGGDAATTTEIYASSTTTSAGENQSIPEMRNNTLEGVGGAGG
jgi:hypothetical protein